jgi:hypothetical protein
MRNNITGSTISNLDYKVSLPTVTISIDDFKVSDKFCLPITYEATLQSQAPLPSFIKWDS